jgi:hypothetical protein
VLVLGMEIACGRYGPPVRAQKYIDDGTARPVEPSTAIKREAVGGREMREMEAEDVYEETNVPPQTGPGSEPENETEPRETED